MLQKMCDRNKLKYNGLYMFIQEDVLAKNPTTDP